MVVDNSKKSSKGTEGELVMGEKFSESGVSGTDKEQLSKV